MQFRVERVQRRWNWEAKIQYKEENERQTWKRDESEYRRKEDFGIAFAESYDDKRNHVLVDPLNKNS